MVADKTENWVSISEFAARRGVTHTAVQKAVKSGRVTAVRRSASGRLKAIEFYAATRQWNENTDTDQAARAGQSLDTTTILPPAPVEIKTPPPGELDLQSGAASNETAPPAAGSGNTAAPNNDADAYLVSRARKEHFAAQQAELEYLKAIGQLVAVADVDREMSEVLNQVKSNVFRIADRKAQILSAEADPTRVHKILNEEFRTVFDECSRRFAVDAPEGADQRAAAGL